jgi:hypothetical protein
LFDIPLVLVGLGWSWLVLVSDELTILKGGSCFFSTPSSLTISTTQVLQTITMFSLCTIQFVLFSLLSLSANAETVRGAHRELVVTAVNLGTAGDFAILAKTGISTVPSSVITGDIGVSPATGATMTGFSLISDLSETFSTSTQVIGNCYAQNYKAPTPTKMIAAVSDMETAYDDAVSRTGGIATVNEIGGTTLAPGVYTLNAITINGDVTFDAGGNPNAVFILQTPTTLNQAAGKSVILAGGALASNIVWQVAGSVTVAAGAHIEGIILTKTLAAFQAGSSLNGRILAQTAVTLISTTITQPAP